MSKEPPFIQFEPSLKKLGKKFGHFRNFLYRYSAMKKIQISPNILELIFIFPPIIPLFIYLFDCYNIQGLFIESTSTLLFIKVGMDSATFPTTRSVHLH